MLSTPHLLVGAAIAGTLKQPEIALPASFLSHYLLDAIPHWDGGGPRPPYKKTTLVKTAVDYLFGIVLVYLLTVESSNQIFLLIGAVTATLPDFIEGGLTFLNPTRITRYQKFHRSIQGRLPFTLGMMTNIIVGLLGAILLPLR